MSENSSNSLGLNIGPYQPGEEDAVLDCFRACFGREQSRETWRHIYLDNPSGQTIIILARKEGTVVCQAAIHPRQIKAFGKEGLAGLGSWAMTRREWRRKGLSRMLLNEAHDMALKQGYMVIYGFPNDKLISNVCKYQGHDVVSPLPLMIRPVRPIRTGLLLLVDKLFGVQQNDRLTFKPDAWMKPSFDDRHTELFNEVEEIPPIAVMRDSDYLTWRYPAGPESPYIQRDIQKGDAVEATIVLRPALEFGKPMVFVMEWFWKRGCSREALRLMREVFQFARSVRAYGVAALAMPKTIQRRLLWRLGFFCLPLTLFPESSTLTARPNVVDIAGNAAQWVKPSNWYLTFGDGNTL
jgi:GNAT superfamily N-acetyltransferase